MKLIPVDEDNKTRDIKNNALIKQYLQGIIKKKEEPKTPSKALPKVGIKVNPRLKELVEEINQVQKNINKTQAILSDLGLSETEITWNRVASLKEGMSFGELALIDKKGLRAARIVCTTQCQMGILTRADYDKSLAKIEKRGRDQMLDFLYSMPQF